MGPARWKRLAEAVARRYRALLAVLRDPQGAREKAAAAEAARCAAHALCPLWQPTHTPLAAWHERLTRCLSCKAQP